MEADVVILERISAAAFDPGKVTVLAAEEGGGRRRFLEELVSRAEARGVRTWLLTCDFGKDSLWAGVRDLFDAILPEVHRRNPELVAKHDYELVQVLPLLKRTLAVRNPTLTDTSPLNERVRNYPADRAFRIVHGLIDLLVAAKGSQVQPWVIVCDDYDRVSHIGRRFFRELMRRRGHTLRLSLVVVTRPRSADVVRDWFAPLTVSTADHTVPADLPAEVDRREMERRAEALEEQVGTNIIEIEHHLGDLIRTWRMAERPEKILRWTSKGQSILNILGFYEDALVYGYDALGLQKELAPEDETLHWETFAKLFSSHVALGQAHEAHDLAHREVVDKVQDPLRKAQLSYLMAMLHARYLPERDLELGEKYLEVGLRALEEADILPAHRHFEAVFNRNGLAMIRHFQRRFDESIELCQSGQEQLTAHLGTEEHRLHRSVLRYNLAQVYTALGLYDEALSHYAAAMEIDPNYSEYYNDRGSIYLRLNRLEAAREDYRKAITLSPPYPEVWVNLGQCYRLLGSMEEAEEAYSTALDLDPQLPLAVLGRAQTREALGRVASAIADYDAALQLLPNQWEALANRAVLHYDTGDFTRCLEDLGRAIEFAPGSADLYKNRSLVLSELGRGREAADDLKTYLKLQPLAEDRVEVESRLAALEGASSR